MNISYENIMNLAFDKPLEFKTLSLYPAKLPYYSIFSSAEECLDISRLNERDLRLMRLPYLEYIYEKSLVDEGFKNRWNMLICILSIVLQEQSFDIIREDGRLYLKVYQRSKDYELLNKKYIELQNKILLEHKSSGKVEKDNLINISKELETLKEAMYNIIKIGSEDFDEMRELIMLQNDIKPQHFDAETEDLLYKMKAKLKEASQSKADGINFEDLIDIVSYCTHFTVQELEQMTIRRFHRYLDIALSKDDYYMYKTLELSGAIKLKSELPHWIRHYEPKGKFDDILIDGGKITSELKEGKN